jgi:hypothetical protein
MATIMNRILMCLVKRPLAGTLLDENGDTIIDENGNTIVGGYL